ncbi:hypothetical protein JW711_06595, partial [Candidatus Woesearchaeota archaeon]|nr:hypothetical protein [Candidatus Woesearchaeota archaeon]
VELEGEPEINLSLIGIKGADEEGLEEYSLDGLDGLEKRTFVQDQDVMERRITPGEVLNATPKMSELISGDVVYESSNARLAGYAPYFVIAVLLLTVAALIGWKKKP